MQEESLDTMFSITPMETIISSHAKNYITESFEIRLLFTQLTENG